MPSGISRITDENGYFTILAAIMLLALLTIISFSGSRSATTEVRMAGNEIVYQRNFYLAEGAAMEAVDRLLNAANLKDNAPDWMDPVAGRLAYSEIDWQNDDSSAGIVPEPAASDAEHVRFVATSEGISPGQSLGMSKSTVHTIAIYGRCEWDGVSTIKVGYLAAF
jgi:hypothetical protein